MASRLNPYLSFKDTAGPAMKYYQQVFGGNLDINTFGSFGDKSAPGADLVMHALLETDSGYTLMASDTPEGMDYNLGTNISVSLSGDDGEELRGYWEKLSAEGTITMPFEKQSWGDEFGMCVDKFGIGWMINVSSPKEGAIPGPAGAQGYG